VVSKILYQPVSIALGVGAGIAARKTFDAVWARIDDDPEGPPNAGDQEASVAKVALAAALQATTFAVTKAVVDRQGRRFYKHVTGFWPGTTREQAAAKRLEAAESSS
jgi:hypothetical protein